KDVKNTTKELANQSAANLRHSVAVALSKSPHPEAIPYLLSKRNDTSEGVRITIVHVLGNLKEEEAVPILTEMTLDKSEMVSKEAKRHLNRLKTATDHPN